MFGTIALRVPSHPPIFVSAFDGPYAAIEGPVVRLRRVDAARISVHDARMPRLSSILTAALWLTLLAVYVLALIPPSGTPQAGADKLQHVAAFLTLAVLASFAMPRRSVLQIGVALALFGAAIEITQLMPLFNRVASIADWLFDLVAIALGLFATAPFRRRFQDA